MGSFVDLNGLLIGWGVGGVFYSAGDGVGMGCLRGGVMGLGLAIGNGW